MPDNMTRPSGLPVCVGRRKSRFSGKELGAPDRVVAHDKQAEVRGPREAQCHCSGTSALPFMCLATVRGLSATIPVRKFGLVEDVHDQKGPCIRP